MGVFTSLTKPYYIEICGIKFFYPYQHTTNNNKNDETHFTFLSSHSRILWILF